MSEKLKKQITHVCIDFILLDSCLFKVVTDVGFRQLLDIVFNADKYSTNLGSLDFSDVLPDSTTVRTSLSLLNHIVFSIIID